MNCLGKSSLCIIFIMQSLFRIYRMPALLISVLSREKKKNNKIRQDCDSSVAASASYEIRAVFRPE